MAAIDSSLLTAKVQADIASKNPLIEPGELTGGLNSLQEMRIYRR
jgi:hypothetical protein